MVIQQFCSIVRIGVLSAALGFGQTPPNPADTNFNGRLPPVSLATTETLQINVLNTANTSSDGIAASCNGTITFYDAEGSMIGKEFFLLASGQIASAKLTYSSTKAPTPRTVVSGNIAVGFVYSGFVPPPPTLPPCTLKYSVETYDTVSGVTHALFTGVIEGYNNAPAETRQRESRR